VGAAFAKLLSVTFGVAQADLSLAGLGMSHSCGRREDIPPGAGGGPILHQIDLISVKPGQEKKIHSISNARLNSHNHNQEV